VFTLYKEVLILSKCSKWHSLQRSVISGKFLRSQIMRKPNTHVKILKFFLIERNWLEGQWSALMIVYLIKWMLIFKLINLKIIIIIIIYGSLRGWDKNITEFFFIKVKHGNNKKSIILMFLFINFVNFLYNFLFHPYFSFVHYV